MRCTVPLDVSPMWNIPFYFHELAMLWLPNTRISMLTVFHFTLAHVHVDRYGYDTLTIVRPKLYDILLSRIPAYKILFNKRVTSSAQNHDGVKVRCEDGTSYTGDILVAADGGASPIRESFYEEIKKRSKKVPHPSDYARPKLDQRCIVGVTKPLDVRKYPILLSKQCELLLVMPKENNCMVSNFYLYFGL